MSDRATADLILLWVAATLCLLLIIGTIGIIVVELVVPETNTAPAVDAIGRVATSLITVTVGYLAGMRSKRRNGGGD